MVLQYHNPVVTRNNVDSFFVADVLDIGECGDSDNKSTQEVNKDVMVDDELCVNSLHYRTNVICICSRMYI